MKFETVQIYFQVPFSVCCHPETLLLWQGNVTSSPLYWTVSNSQNSYLGPRLKRIKQKK